MAEPGLLVGARALITRDFLTATPSEMDASAAEDEASVRVPRASPPKFASSLIALKESPIERPLATGDDYADDPSTTGVVTAGGTNFGVFETAGDSDWFSITLEEGQTLIITTNANPSRPQIAFLDASGTLIEPEFAIQQGSFTWVYSLRAPTSDTCFVAASPNAFPEAIAYNFSAQVYAADDFAADVSTTGSLNSGSATGTFERVYDADWFAITLDAGQTIDITGPFWLTYIRFYDGAGNPVEVEFLRAFNGDNAPQTAGIAGDDRGNVRRERRRDRHGRSVHAQRDGI